MMLDGLKADFASRADMHRMLAKSRTPAVDAATGKTVLGFDPDEERRWIEFFERMVTSLESVSTVTMERVRQVFESEPFAEECFAADIEALKLNALPLDAPEFLERFLVRFPNGKG